jgi:hypothetical protein
MNLGRLLDLSMPVSLSGKKKKKKRIVCPGSEHSSYSKAQIRKNT